MSGLKGLAGLEFRLLGRGNLDGFTGARVTAGGGCAMRHGESTEPDNTNFVAALQSAFDTGKHGVDSTTGVGLGEARGVSDRCNKIVLFMENPSISSYTNVTDLVYSFLIKKKSNSGVN